MRSTSQGNPGRSGSRPDALGPGGAAPLHAARTAGEHVSLWRVLGPFAVATGLLALLCVAGFFVLSGARAYVGGESLWSKGRSIAVAHLRLYSVTGAPDAYDRFVAALEVPLGDRAAREALERSPADMTTARAGFVLGGNDAGDAEVMVWLYRCCSGTPLMREAVSAWVEGDRLIEQLAALGGRMQQQVSRHGTMPDVRHDEMLVQLDELEARLIWQELRFSASLGQVSRSMLWLLIAATLLLAALLAATGVALGRRSLQRYELARQQLAQANRRWSLATASDGLGLFEWDVSRDEIFLDARTAALYGVEHQADGVRMSRDQLRERLHAADRGAVRAAFDAAAASGELFKQRFRVLHADGSERHVEVTGLVHHSGDPLQPQRMVGVTRDVSDEVANSRLALDKAAAERVARARIEFLSRLSHELRTPLNAVLGFSQLLLTDVKEPLSPGHRARVQHIGAAGEHLLRLVEDVLDITHIDSGQFAMSPRPLALQPVVDAALRLVEKERQAHDVRVVHALPAQPLFVMADAQRLEQVFVNLLSNGCKYNRRGGTLVIEHETIADNVRVSVRDEGTGLDAHERAQLFQPFKRLAAAGTTPGTGLGLVVVKLLLEQMGGAIEVDSVKGQGCTFTVSLPLVAAQVVSVTSEQADRTMRDRTTAGA